jgi:hypothetical protein
LTRSAKQPSIAAGSALEIVDLDESSADAQLDANRETMLAVVAVRRVATPPKADLIRGDRECFLR